MAGPTIASTPMIVLTVRLQWLPVGTTPFGIRAEVPFEGTAVSEHWGGEWRVSGIDHITRSATGIAGIDVHTVITDGAETIRSHGIGRSGPHGIAEGVTFETASERLAWLNETVAVGRGRLDGDELTIELFAIAP